MASTPEAEKIESVPTLERRVDPSLEPSSTGENSLEGYMDKVERGEIKKPVTDDNNSQVLLSPTDTEPTEADGTEVQIPLTVEELKTEVKGDSADSKTWFAVFWERIVKMAVKAGRKVIFRS